jgi:hypothetical protein
MQTLTSRKANSPGLFTALCVLSGLALLAFPGGAQERKPSEQEIPQRTVDPRPGQGQAGQQSVTGAIQELRRTIAAELGRMPAMQDRPVDESKLYVLTTDRNNVIAGAPTRGATIGAGGETPGAGRELTRDADTIGVVMLVGNFETSTSTRGRPTEGSAPIGASGGTFVVRKAAGGMNAGGMNTVELVDSRDQVVATIPVMQFHSAPSPMGGQTGQTGQGQTGQGQTGQGQTGQTGQSGQAGQTGQTGQTAGQEGRQTGMGLRSSGEDWGRIYMSIVHYFSPDLG